MVDDTVRAKQKRYRLVAYLCRPGCRPRLRAVAVKDRLRWWPGTMCYAEAKAMTCWMEVPEATAIDASNNKIDPGNRVHETRFLVDSEDVLTLGTDWTATAQLP